RCRDGGPITAEPADERELGTEAGAAGAHTQCRGRNDEGWRPADGEGGCERAGDQDDHPEPEDTAGRLLVGHAPERQKTDTGHRRADSEEQAGVAERLTLMDQLARDERSTTSVCSAGETKSHQRLPR